ncbi:MAG: tetratricopeptide repeat protein, partial [Gammaproteobacteria bacterium]|nr:tetratricopeptide repeat protein [Gammaproteobacteria bacterium]
DEIKALNNITKIIKTVLSKDPNNIDAQILEASVNIHNNENQKASEQLSNILKIRPDTFSAIILLANQYEKESQIEQTINIYKNGLKNAKDKDKEKLRLQLASFYERNKRLDDAIKTMQEAIKLYPDNYSYKTNLASIYLQQNKINEAENIYRRALNEAPNESYRYLVLSEFMAREKGISYAITELENAAKALPEHPDILIALAINYQKAGKKELSVQLLENIITQWKTTPTGIKARKALAKYLPGTGDTSRTRMLVDEILKEIPTDNDALIIKAKLAINDKDYDTAINALRTVMKEQPDSIEVIQLLIEAHLNKGEIELARNTLEKSIELSPDNFDIHLKLARFNIATKNIDTALDQINNLLDKRPDHFETLIVKSEALAAKGEINKVITVLNRLKQLKPDNPEGWFRMGRLYKSQNKPDKSIIELDSAFDKNPESEDLLAELIDLEISQKKQSSSIKRLQNLINKQPEHPFAYKLIGMVYLSEKENGKAKQMLDKHLTIKPDDTPIYTFLADYHKNRAEFDQAANYFIKGLNSDPNNFALKFGLAGTYELQKNYDQAIEIYEDILTQQKDNLIATNNLVTLLVNHKNDQHSLERAEKLAEQFKNSNQPALQDTLGWVYYKLGRYNDALTYLQQATQSAPAVSTFNFHLAMAYIETNDKTKAIKHLEMVTSNQRYPEYKKAKAALEKLK